MNVGHQGTVVSLLCEFFADVFQVSGFFRTLGCDAHNFATRIEELHGFFHRCLRIQRWRYSHRLNSNGIVSSNAHGAHHYLSGKATGVLEGIIHIVAFRLKFWPGGEGTDLIRIDG